MAAPEKVRIRTGQIWKHKTRERTVRTLLAANEKDDDWNIRSVETGVAGTITGRNLRKNYDLIDEREAL